ERLQRPTDGLPRELVGLEDVPTDDDELALLLLGDYPKPTDRIDPGGGEPCLGLTLEKMPGHADLPVSRVQEPNHLLLLPMRCPHRTRDHRQDLRASPARSRSVLLGAREWGERPTCLCSGGHAENGRHRGRTL